MRQNHQYLRVPLEPEVDLDFRGHLSNNVKNGFLAFKNMKFFMNFRDQSINQS